MYLGGNRRWVPLFHFRGQINVFKINKPVFENAVT